MLRLPPRFALLVGLVILTAANLPAADTTGQARQLWQQGQEAMRQGKADEAVRRYQESLAADPSFFRNHLSLAAAYLDQGDQARACPQFGLYLQACPQHVIVRAHYAELLLRLNHTGEARTEFQRFAADAQEQSDQYGKQLIHCHSRLMEIAEGEEDGYAEHLHRGIGLFLLARQQDAQGPDAEPSAESLLCRAAAELTLARIERPDEAQPCWYLYEVWTRLAQRHAALRCLHDADLTAPFSYLTPTEQTRLALACRRAQVQASPK
jgi:tetratricopeptide (TPR) repeat protein